MSQQETLLRERLRDAALALRELRLERDALRKEKTEPIAIVGIGCRLPGSASSPESFWELLETGRDAIVPLDARWNLVGKHPDPQVPRWAGLLTTPVDTFDPFFFGISPREARAMDPQQRLLLEVAWESLEDAGIVPESLKQSRTGVFVGACANDYADLAVQQPEADQDAYLATGNMLSILAGRLSYTLGLQGPCVTLDTACSSSLVAIHLAGRSLRSRECDLAIAGGVNLILSPDSMTALSRTQALSPDGRCRTFDALANGYVRGEGCCVLVLKRLGDAERGANRIWAVIRGSAVNQDGRSTGLTAPNVLSQQSLLREALSDAAIAPEAVGYVETHGTGTALGDPIEVQALQTVLGTPRSDGSVCVLGALKTNIGHLEAAAGVAGVIKAALVLAKERIPKNLNLRTLNAHIELEGSALTLAKEAISWPRAAKPRIAGVSGFGLSGTNAHIVLEEAPASARAETVRASALPFLLSGRSGSVLSAQAQQLRTFLLSHPDVALADVAYTLACKRTHFEHRECIVASQRESLIEDLAALAEGRSSPHSNTTVPRTTGKLALLFTGQGSQRPMMGHSLADAFPPFREALDAALAVIDPLLPQPLRAVMSADAGTAHALLIEQTEYTQPALFALQVALYRCIEGLGIRPDLLLGHSVGEIAAAHIAGVLSLRDACRLVVARGRLMQALPAKGAMVDLQATESEVRSLLVGKEQVVDIAAVNGPQHTVISGEEEAVLAIAQQLQERGRKCKQLAVSHAFHSPCMDAMLPAFAQTVAQLSFHKPRIGIVSSTSGELSSESEMAQPAYWVEQARRTVHFERAMVSLGKLGTRRYVELGPRGVLCALGAECLSDSVLAQSALVPLLRGNGEEHRAFLQALGQLHIHGQSVDWDALLRPIEPRQVDVPTYPFERQRCWLEVPRHNEPPVTAPGICALAHPLLSFALPLADSDGFVFAGLLSTQTDPWLLEHSIYAVPIFPGTGFLELALLAAQQLELPGIQELELSSPLSPSEQAPIQLQLRVLPPDATGNRSFVLSSRAKSESLKTPWVQHGSGVFSQSVRPFDHSAITAWPPPQAESVDLSGLYEAFSERGLGYGPAYRGLRAVWKAKDAIYVEAQLPDELHKDAARFGIHPALLDTTLHGLAAVLSADSEEAAVMLIGWQHVRLFSSGAKALRARIARISTQEGERSSTSLVAWTESGQPVLTVDEVTLQRVQSRQLLMARSQHLLHVVKWLPARAESPQLRTGETWVLSSELSPFQNLGAAAFTSLESLSLRLQSVGPPAQILFDVATDSTQPKPVAAQARTAALLPVLQTFLRDERLAETQLVILTHGAVSIEPKEDLDAIEQAPIWGFVRSAASEHRNLRLRLLDVDRHSTAEQIRTALQTTTEPELALRAGTLRVPRLTTFVGSHQSTTSAVPEPLHRLSQGTVLITGGTGELAMLLSRHLVMRYGARHVVLVSRRGIQSPGAENLVQQLGTHGAIVHVVSCDVGNRQALAAVIGSIPSKVPLRAVFHLAAVLDDAPVSAISPEGIARVFAPKLDAAWHLHTLTESLDLDAFVLFSSAASVLGPPGQASYAAANAFLDALAYHRRHCGLPGQSVAWGPWQSAGGGLTAKLTKAQLDRHQNRGFGLLTEDDGLALLDAALCSTEALLVPIRLDSDRLRAFSALAPPILWGQLASVHARTNDSDRADARTLLTRLHALPAKEQLREVQQVVLREVAVVLGMPSGTAPTPEQALRNLGLDSLMIVELRNRLAALLDIRFELQTVWRLANLRELAAELQRLLTQQTAAVPVHVIPETTTAILAASRPVFAPLSAGQQRLYFLDRVLTLRHTYNVSLAVRLPAPLSVSLLRTALEQVMARHEQLRMCIQEQDGPPRQRILPWLEAPLEEHELPADTDHPDSAIRRFVEKEVQRPFQLSQAPLFRVLYIRLGKNASALGIVWHHIATDGASVSVFLSELSTAYQAAEHGEQIELAAGPSYALYAQRQREWLQSEASSAQRSYWASKLQGLPSLELPSDRPVTRQRTERGGLVPFPIPAAVITRIDALTKELRTTPFVIVLAAWSALLSRLSGQQDFAIGSTMLGRSEDSVRDAIGFFVNTLPLRCPLHGEPTAQQYIERLHQELWSALDHQELPLDEIVRVVTPDRQPGFIGSPLFRTCVSYNESREPLDSFGGQPAVVVCDPVIEKVGATSKFDLTLSVMRHPSGFSAALEYSTDLFDEETIKQWSKRFLLLLSALVEQPQQKIYELPLLSADELQRMLYEWNDTTAAYPQDHCIHQIFEARVAQTPDTVALVYQDLRLSYRVLNAKANQLAHRLRTLGVGPEKLVALYVERSIEMVVAILGVLKAGGAYVPIDPDAPTERVDFMLKDTAPVAILTQRILLGNLPPVAGKTLCLDDQDLCAEEAETNLDCIASPTCLAYVIYTSGSTGRPKGVQMAQHAVNNLLQALNRRAWGSPPLNTAMLAPIFFDMSVKPLFGALLYGHTLYIVDKDTRRDGRALLSFFQRNKIEWSDCTPSILAMLVDAGLPACQPLALQVLLCGGEALSTALVASIYDPGHRNELQIINVYGPTETCVNVNANPVTAQTIDRTRAVVPMGRPFENTQLYVLDSHLQPVPVGVQGELHISGVGLARGYLHQPALTAEKFIRNPFLSGLDARMYKTGDLVRYLSDGKIEFLGRIDHQIKLHGYRIELGEIESILRSHSDVASCVVLAREDRTKQKRLFAYVVPQPGHTLSVDALRTHLAKQLPSYMIPTAIVCLSELPLTRNGKVDRKALPDPMPLAESASFVPPEGPLECALSDLFSSVLHRPRIGRHEDLFACGLDSLLAVRIVARAEQAGLALSVNHIFRNPQIAQLREAMTGSLRPSHLLPLREGHIPGSVVLLPGAGGVLHHAHEVARALDTGMAVYTVMSPTLVDSAAPPASVAELALRYAHDLCQQIPQGRLILVGYSFGGAVAIELAEALRAQQRDVDQIILIDTRPIPQQAELDGRTALAGLVEALGISPQRLSDATQPDELSALTSLLAPDVKEAQGLRSFLLQVLESAQHATQLFAKWSAHIPNLPVHLLRTEEQDATSLDYGWSRYGALSSVQTIAGQHHSLLRSPYLDGTMRAIAALIKQGRLSS